MVNSISITQESLGDHNILGEFIHSTYNQSARINLDKIKTSIESMQQGQPSSRQTLAGFNLKHIDSQEGLAQVNTASNYLYNKLLLSLLQIPYSQQQNQRQQVAREAL